MPKRDEHLFEFEAGQITEAAHEEYLYHCQRETYWKDEYTKAVETVRQTASVKHPVTGGMRADVAVDYGDAYRRMGEAFEKAQLHRAAAGRFDSESQLYGSQNPAVPYELSAEDVHYFRLSGRPREE